MSRKVKLFKFLKKIKKMRFWRVPLMLVLVVSGLVVYAFCVHSPLKDMVMFRVGRGDSVVVVAQRLERAGAIKSVDLFKVAVRLNGGRVLAGDYEIPRRASVWCIADMLAEGRVATTTIVIPEGLTIKQIKQLLITVPELVGDVECEKNKHDDVCDLRDGDVFPDTYRVARGTSRLAVLDLARKKMLDIKDVWERAGRMTPYPLKNWNQIITLASIVQKETPKVREMPIVASVYLNRLRKKMRLQADPTVVYALTDRLGDMRGAPLLRGHLQLDSPYNTYKNFGLPPAPIANVGQDAIRAVLKPADTNYLFCVADGRGGHRFSKTYEEHKKNHANWRAIKKSKNKI